jgi:hypothetical protein
MDLCDRLQSTALPTELSRDVPVTLRTIYCIQVNVLDFSNAVSGKLLRSTSHRPLNVGLHRTKQ